MNSLCCWIKPDGEIIETKTNTGHILIAAKELNGASTSDAVNKGWIRIFRGHLEFNWKVVDLKKVEDWLFWYFVETNHDAPVYIDYDKRSSFYILTKGEYQEFDGKIKEIIKWWRNK